MNSQSQLRETLNELANMDMTAVRSSNKRRDVKPGINLTYEYDKKILQIIKGNKQPNLPDFQNSIFEREKSARFLKLKSSKGFQEAGRGKLSKFILKSSLSIKMERQQLFDSGRSSFKSTTRNEDHDKDRENTVTSQQSISPTHLLSSALVMSRKSTINLPQYERPKCSNINDEHDDNLNCESTSSIISTYSSTVELESKLFCVIALCNWARNPMNTARLASEGAIKAITQISNENNHEIQVYCSVAFRYMSEQQILASNIITDGAFPRILDLINSHSDELIVNNLLYAIFNLTLLNGKESLLVENGIILGFENATSIFPELGLICAHGLYNLTCVEIPYPNIDRVLRQLVAFASYPNNSMKYTCLSGLCNLSDMKKVRSKLVEEGALELLSDFTNASDLTTRKLCAVILQNLSDWKPSRVEMILRGAIDIAFRLSIENDCVVTKSIAITISNLSRECSMHPRIIADNGVIALSYITTKIDFRVPISNSVSIATSSAFYNFSIDSKLRNLVVTKDALASLSTVLKRSQDFTTLQNTLACISNLLNDEKCHKLFIAQHIIESMLDIIGLHLPSENSESVPIHSGTCRRAFKLMETISVAFLNLSRCIDSQQMLIESNSIPAIIQLSKLKLPMNNVHVSLSLLHTQRRCSAIFAYLSSHRLGVPYMIANGIVPALFNILQTVNDAEVVNYIAITSCQLCHSSLENSILVLNSGILSNFISRIVDSGSQGKFQVTDVTEGIMNSSVQLDISNTFTSTCCLLSYVTSYEQCRLPLCLSMNLIPAIVELSTINDPMMKQRCLHIFANISCEPSVHTLLGQFDVVKIISSLSNSYSELNYNCCAKTICNISFSESFKNSIISSDGIDLLLIISLVRSVDYNTKYICALALYNLLDESTIDCMLDKSVIASVSNLARLQDPSLLNLCSKLLNKISKFECGRIGMIQKPSYLSSLLSMVSSNDDQTKIISVRTICNLLECSNIQNKLIESEALSVVLSGLQHCLSNTVRVDDIYSQCAVHCIQTIFATTQNSENLLVLIQIRMHEKLLPFIGNGNAGSNEISTKTPLIVREYIFKILLVLSWNDQSRKILQSKEYLAQFIGVVDCDCNCNQLGKQNSDDCLPFIIASLNYLLSGHCDILSLAALNFSKLLSNSFDLLMSREAINPVNHSPILPDGSIVGSSAATLRIPISEPMLLTNTTPDSEQIRLRAAITAFIGVYVSLSRIPEILTTLYTSKHISILHYLSKFNSSSVEDNNFNIYDISTVITRLSLKPLTITLSDLVSRSASFRQMPMPNCASNCVELACSSVQQIIEVMSIASNYDTCVDHVATSLASFLSNQPSQVCQSFSTPETAKLVQHIMSGNSMTDTHILQKLVICIIQMSKFPKCREILIHEPLCIGTLLHKHNHQAQKTSNLKLRASITLALKTLSAAVSECTVNEGLEEDGEGVMRHELGLELGLDEGEVSTLISSSFEGKMSASYLSQSASSDELVEPDQNETITRSRTNKPSLMPFPDLYNFSAAPWYVVTEKFLAGAAGQGPAVEPPCAIYYDPYTVPVDIENDANSNDGVDTCSKNVLKYIALTKMSLPDENKSKYLLPEEAYRAVECSVDPNNPNGIDETASVFEGVSIDDILSLTPSLGHTASGASVDYGKDSESDQISRNNQYSFDDGVLSSLPHTENSKYISKPSNSGSNYPGDDDRDGIDDKINYRNGDDKGEIRVENKGYTGDNTNSGPECDTTAPCVTVCEELVGVKPITSREYAQYLGLYH